MDRLSVILTCTYLQMPISTSMKIAVASVCGFLLLLGAILIGVAISPSIQSLLEKEVAKDEAKVVIPTRPESEETGPTNLTILRPVEFRRAEYVTTA